MVRTVLRVAGMKCGGCETAVRGVVNGFAGVRACSASAGAGTVEIEYDESVADLDRIRMALAEKGFTVMQAE